MGFAEDIKQKKPFRSERRKALINVIYTAYTLNDQVELFFKRWGLTQKQYNAMRIINGSDAPKGVSTSYIRNRMLVRKGDASRLVDRLVSKGLLSKCIDEKDRRLIHVTISDEGKNLLSDIDGFLDELDELMQNLTIQECELLNQMLDRCRVRQEGEGSA